MKIALIAPSPVPFVFGGAERVWLGLTHHFTSDTNHVCELIKLPSPERNFREIVSSYEQFSRLELSQFDMVISGKYPAWMAAHPNHVVYMLHRLRGLYDTWPKDWPAERMGLPGDAMLDPLRALLANGHTCRSQLPEIFGEIDRLIASGPPADWLALPAALIRCVVHKLDSIGLAPENISKYVAISQTVRARPDYFPPGEAVEVAYVPSDLALSMLAAGEVYQAGDGHVPVFFTASRLDGAKRIDLIIDAFRLVRAPARLVIAGDGPLRHALAERARGDARIAFTGRLSEDDLARHYRQAFAVPFTPYDEDFGLVTLEAFAVGAPVVTVADAGGVLEFVEDGVTGRVAAPDVQSLAAAFEALLADPEGARAMGARARERAQRVTWRNLATSLVLPPAAPRRKRIVMATTFTLWPPDTGGKRRLWSVARELSRRADVTFITLARHDEAAEEIAFSRHFREIRIPVSHEHIHAEWALTKILKETSVSDISATLYGHLTPAFVEELRGRLAGADLAIACHPYLYRFIREGWEGPVWYDAANVETLLKDPILPRTPAGRAVLAEVAKVELECVQGSERILTVSAAEGDIFHTRFGKPADQIMRVPNGTDLPARPLLERAQRHALKHRLGVYGPLALYIGSWHAPNVEAAVALVGIARKCPKWTFWLVGDMARDAKLRKLTLPRNVALLGRVDDDEAYTLFSAANVGINPVSMGAGTNLKVIDYAAHGALVLTTPIGIRGLDMHHGEQVIVSPREEMASALHMLADMPLTEQERLAHNAFVHVRDHFTWEKVVADIGF